MIAARRAAAEARARARALAFACSSRLSRSSSTSASSLAAPRSTAEFSSRRAAPASPRSTAAAPVCSSSSPSRCRSAIALRARSMYALARAWPRSRNSTRVQTLIAQFVLADEVVIEAGEQKALDPCVSVALRQFSRFGELVGTKRVGHRQCVQKMGSKFEGLWNRQRPARQTKSRRCDGRRTPVLQDPHADHRVDSQRQRRTARRRHRGAGRRDPRARPARDCSTIRPTPPTIARSSRWPATPPRVEAAIARAGRRRRPARSICGSISGEHPRLGAVDVVPFVPIEGVTMANCVALAKEVGAAIAERFARASLPLRGGLGRRRAQEPRGHPPRRVRRAGRQDGDRRLDAGLRSRRAASLGGRVRRRRPYAAHRLQHQSEHRPYRRREEDRRGDPAQQRRTPVREGDGRAGSTIAISRRSR